MVESFIAYPVEAEVGLVVAVAAWLVWRVRRISARVVGSLVAVFMVLDASCFLLDLRVWQANPLVPAGYLVALAGGCIVGCISLGRSRPAEGGGFSGLPRSVAAILLAISAAVPVVIIAGDASFWLPWFIQNWGGLGIMAGCFLGGAVLAMCAAAFRRARWLAYICGCLPLLLLTHWVVVIPVVGGYVLGCICGMEARSPRGSAKFKFLFLLLLYAAAGVYTSFMTLNTLTRYSSYFPEYGSRAILGALLFVFVFTAGATIRSLVGSACLEPGGHPRSGGTRQVAVAVQMNSGGKVGV
jgi:hypothetical protein